MSGPTMGGDAGGTGVQWQIKGEGASELKPLPALAPLSPQNFHEQNEGLLPYPWVNFFNSLFFVFCGGRVIF